VNSILLFISGWTISVATILVCLRKKTIDLRLLILSLVLLFIPFLSERLLLFSVPVQVLILVFFLKRLANYLERTEKESLLMIREIVDLLLKDQAKDLEKMKLGMSLETISHDLRSPLTVMKGTAQLGVYEIENVDFPTKDAVLEAFQIIDDQVELMVKRMNEILTLATRSNEKS
jgi:signal transduction histidine kinase